MKFWLKKKKEKKSPFGFSRGGFARPVRNPPGPFCRFCLTFQNLVTKSSVRLKVLSSRRGARAEKSSTADFGHNCSAASSCKPSDAWFCAPLCRSHGPFAVICCGQFCLRSQFYLGSTWQKRNSLYLSDDQCHESSFPSHTLNQYIHYTMLHAIKCMTRILGQI